MASSQLLSTPSTHRWSFAGLADAVLNHVKELVFQSSWSPLTRLAESAAVLYVVFFSLFIAIGPALLLLCSLIRHVTITLRMLIVPAPLFDVVA
jgi:hypothetical protein